MILYNKLDGSLNPLNIFKILKYRKEFRKNNPDYFDPDGLLVFTGPQGSGKTLSAVKYTINLMNEYKKAILVTNIDIKSLPVDNNRIFRFNNNDDLSRYNNDKLGVIFLIDEIQLYFNSLDSKNIDPQVMVQISQQRKQRKHIVCTSQVFGRLAKPLREQFSNVIFCKNYLGFIQRNRLIDRDSMDGDSSTSTELKGKVKKSFWWLHHPDDYDLYDTYNIINNNFRDIKGGELEIFKDYDELLNEQAERKKNDRL